MTQAQTNKLPEFITPSKFRETTQVNRHWTATPSVDTPFEDLLRPDYWAHVAANILPGDRIDVLAEDMSYFAELLVVDASRQWVKVKLLRKTELSSEESQPIEADDEHEVKWRGNRRWSVVRKADGAILQEELSSKSAAYAWLSEHQKKVA